MKGYYVEVVDKNAPYTHSLSLLAERTKLRLTDDQQKLLEKVTDFSIKAGYPGRKFEFYELCTKEYTRDWLEKTKEFYQWMQQKF